MNRVREQLVPRKESFYQHGCVKRIGWFGDSLHLYTLVDEKSSDPKSRDSHTLRAWDSHRRTVIFEQSQLYDGEIGPFDFLYTLDRNQHLNAWNIKTGDTNMEGRVKATHCEVLSASHRYLYTGPGYGSEHSKEKSASAELWSRQISSDGSRHLSKSSRSSVLTSVRLDGEIDLQFSTRGSLAVALYDFGIGSVYVRLLNMANDSFGCDATIELKKKNDRGNQPSFEVRISPDDTYVAILVRGCLTIRSIAQAHSGCSDCGKLDWAWSEERDQEYELPFELHNDDFMAGLAISPDSRYIAIMTIFGRLMVLRRLEKAFEHMFVATELSALDASRRNNGVRLSWSPNGRLLAVGHDNGPDVLKIEGVFKSLGVPLDEE